MGSTSEETNRKNTDIPGQTRADRAELLLLVAAANNATWAAHLLQQVIRTCRELGVIALLPAAENVEACGGYVAIKILAAIEARFGRVGLEELEDQQRAGEQAGHIISVGGL